jgi:endonuclease YncB( thermonuclease family)
MGLWDGWRGDKQKKKWGSDKDDSTLTSIVDTVQGSVTTIQETVTLTPEAQSQWNEVEAKAQSQWNEVQDLLSSSTALACLGGVSVVSFLVGWKVGSLSRTMSAWTRRLTDVSDIGSSYIGPTAPWLRGRVVSVSDGDTVRFLHAPTWFHSSKLQEGEKLSDLALPIRVCTIDTPETAKFGKPGQPYGEEAKKCLEKLSMDKMVQIHLLQKDQYGRAVAELRSPRFLWWNKYADQELLQAGLAEVWQNWGTYSPGSFTPSELPRTPRARSSFPSWILKMGTGAWWSHPTTNGISHTSYLKNAPTNPLSS